jgi:hypothetical protein
LGREKEGFKEGREGEYFESMREDGGGLNIYGKYERNSHGK